MNTSSEEDEKYNCSICGEIHTVKCRTCKKWYCNMHFDKQCHECVLIKLKCCLCEDKSSLRCIKCTKWYCDAHIDALDHGCVKELKIYKKQSIEIDAMLESVKEDIKQKQAAMDILQSQKANLKMELERHALRKMSAIWFILTAVVFALMLQTYANGSYVYCTLTAYAFLSNYRALYVLRTPHALNVAFVIILATLYSA